MATLETKTIADELEIMICKQLRVLAKEIIERGVGKIQDEIEHMLSVKSQQTNQMIARAAWEMMQKPKIQRILKAMKEVE